MDHRVHLLADRPRDAEAIAGWHFGEWGPYSPGETLEQGRRRLLGWSERDRIPLTLVAVVGGGPAGSASVVEHDMEQPPPELAGLSPWVSGVYVVPEHRKEGLGPALVGGCEEKVRDLGHDILYLYTSPVTAVKFYEPMGWSTFARLVYEGEDVVVMRKSL